MLEGLVAWVLNNYLGKYVENLNTDQLSIALLSGEVELENLPLRRDALRSLGLPLQVRAGFIGRVRLQIPVRQFRSAPWVILIEQLNLVAGPINLDDWDADLEQSTALEVKLGKLDALEARWRAEREGSEQAAGVGYYASSYSSWLSYGTSLVAGIVENLQLKIRDVHIRYEDNLSIPGQIFACGITLGSLTAQGSPNVEVGTTSKLMELQALSIYWDALQPSDLLGDLNLGELPAALNKHTDHKYILRPVGGQAQFTRDCSDVPQTSRTKPRLICDLKLELVPLSLIDWQYEQMFTCIHGLDRISRTKKYRLHRPRSSVRENPRAWWMYALICNGHDIFRRPTWTDCSEKARQNINYVAICTKLLVSPLSVLTAEQKEIKDAMEMHRSFDELKALREISMHHIPKPATASAVSNQGRSMLFQWFPQYWGWYSRSKAAPSSPSQTESPPTAVSQLENDILDAIAVSVEDDPVHTGDSVFGQFNFTLKQGTFIICMGEVFKESTPMLELYFETVQVSLETRPRSLSYQLQIALGSLSILDRVTKDSVFPTLVCPQGKDGAPLSRVRPPQVIRARNAAGAKVVQSVYPETTVNATEPLFQLCYEKKPLGYNTDFRLSVKSQALDVVYNPGAAQWLIDFLSKPHQTASARRQIEVMKMKTKIELMRNWENILDGDSERKSWCLEMDISAPQIIFVENFTDRSGSVVVLDFGRFLLTNNQFDKDTTADRSYILTKESLAHKDSEDDEMFMTPCSTPPGSEASGSSSPTLCSASGENLANVLGSFESPGLSQGALHQKIYDKYTVRLCDLQVLVGRARDNWSFAHSKGTSNLHLLDRFDISLQIERRLVHTLDPQYPSLIVSGILPRLVVHFAEQKISALRTLIDIIGTRPKHSPFRSPTMAESFIPESISEIPESHIDKSELSRESSVKLFTLQFSVEQLALEVQSRGRSVAELQVSGVRLGFTRSSTETSATLLVHGLLLVDALQTFGPDFELLVASHKHVGMDSVSGSLRDSEPCSPVSPSSPDPLQIPKQFTSPYQLSQALSSLQRAVSPSWPPNESGTNRTDIEALITVEVLFVMPTDDDEQLQVANIQFNNLDIIANQETIVELMGFAKRVFPEFNSLSKKKYKPGPPAHLSKQQTPGLDIGHKTRTEIIFDFHRLNVLVLRAIMKDGELSGRKVATATMSEARIYATLGDSYTVEGSLGGLQVLDLTPAGGLHQRVLSVGKDPLTDPPRAPVDLLETLTSEIYTFSSSGYNKPNTTNFNETQAFSFCVKWQVANKDTLEVILRMASVWYTHSPPLLVELQWCATEFQTYFTNLARSIKAHATEMAIGLVQARMDTTGVGASNRTDGFSTWKKQTQSVDGSPSPLRYLNKIQVRLDIVLDTPVLVVPRSSSSAQVFVAHLGKISVTNNGSLTEVFKNKEKHLSTENSCYMVDSLHDDMKTLNSNREIYVVEVRDMNLYTLDTSSRRGFTFSGILSRAEQLYSSQGGQPVLHDTSVRLELFRYSPESVVEMHPITDIDDKYIKDCLQITGCVITSLRVSLSRLQYEQLIATVENLASRPELPGPHQTTNQMKTETVESVQTSFVPVLASERNADLYYKVDFNLPHLTLELRGDCGEGQQGLVEISLRDFKINYEKTHKYETNIQVSLHSIVMEDLLREPDSRHRYMVISSPNQGPMSWNGTGYVSRSCPNLVQSAYFASGSPRSSLPDHLETGHIFGAHLKGAEHKLNICPNTPPPSPHHQSVQTRSDTLVRISVLLVDTNVPEFKEKYHSLRKTISIDFNSLDMVVGVESWVVVLDFFGLSDSSQAESMPHEPEEDVDDQRESNSDIEIDIRSLTLVLTRPENEIAKANISNAQITISQTGCVKTIQGRLGSMSLLDLTSHNILYRERFATAGREALNFTYINNGKKHDAGRQSNRSPKMSYSDATISRSKKFVKLSSSSADCAEGHNSKDKNEKDCDISLRLQMSSVRYVHTKRFVAEIQAFFRHFSQLQNLMRSLRQSSEVTEDKHSTRLLLDITAESPVIILPVSSRSEYLLVGDLGAFTASNTFLKSNDPDIISTKRDIHGPIEVLDVMMINLVNTDLFTGMRYTKENHIPGCEVVSLVGFKIIRLGQSLLAEKCHLQVQTERNLDYYCSHNVADLTIQVTLSKLEASLDLEQYKLIRGLLMYNLGEVLDDIDEPLSFNESDENQDRVYLQENIWTSTCIRFHLHNVSLDLQVKPNEPLACINFIKSKLTLETYSDNSQDIDLVSQEIILTDTRYRNEPANKRCNVFPNVLQPINFQSDNEIVQLEVHSRKRRDRSKFTILLNNMRLMAILDWLEAARDYLVQYQTIPEIIPSPYRVSDDSSLPFELKLNITDSELVVVEDASLWDTNAIILKVNTSVISYKQGSTRPLSVNLNQLELFSCVLGMEEDSALSIIDPVTIQADLNGLGLLEVQLHTLNIRLSYHDVRMFSQMLRSLPGQTLNARNKNIAQSPPANTKNLIEKLSALGFSRADCVQALESCHHQLDEAALWLTKYAEPQRSPYESLQGTATHINISALEVKANCISLCVIDDCKDSDVPLLELSLSKLTFQKDLRKQSIDNAHDNHGNIPYINSVQETISNIQKDSSNINFSSTNVPKLSTILQDEFIFSNTTNDLATLQRDFLQSEQSASALNSSRRTSKSSIEESLSTSNLTEIQGVRMQAILASDYYNRALSGWEPFIEHWKCDIAWKYGLTSALTKERLQAHIKSKDILNVNVTSTVLELYETVRNNWTEDYYSQSSGNGYGKSEGTSQGYRRRAPFVPFALKNESGHILWFHTFVATPDSHATMNLPNEDESGWELVAPGETAPFSFSGPHKQRHQNTHKLTLHQVCVRLEGWHAVGPVSVDKVGVYFRHADVNLQTMISLYLTNFQRVLKNIDLPRARIVFAVSLEGSAQKLVTVRSALRVINQIGTPVQVKMENVIGHLGINNWPPTHETIITPGNYYSVPLSHAHSQIWIRPILDARSNYEEQWDKSQLTWSKSSPSFTRKHSVSYGTPSSYGSPAWDPSVQHAIKTLQRKSFSGLSKQLSGFQYCGQPIQWWHILQSGETAQQLRACCEKDITYRFVASIHRENYPMSSGGLRVQPAHTITLLPPVVLQNSLPCDVLYRTANARDGRIPQNSKAALTDIDLEKSVELSIALDNFPGAGILTITAGVIGTANHRLRLTDFTNRPLHLQATVTAAKGAGLQIIIWCPYWIVNRTGLPLVFRQEGAGLETAGQGPEHETARMVAPLLFSFSDIDASPSFTMRRGKYHDGGIPQWCQPLHLQSGVQVRRLVTSLADGRPDNEALVGVEVRPGRSQHQSTVVTISPRFQIYNRSSHKLQFAQKCFATTVSDPGAQATHQDSMIGCHQPFHWPRLDRPQLLCIRILDISGSLWSGGIKIDHNHSLHVNIRDYLGAMHFIRLEVLLQGATFFVVVGDAEELPPSIRIDNYSEVPITFFQSCCKDQFRSVAKPQAAMAYALDEPSEPALIYLQPPGGVACVYDINETGKSRDLTYENFIYIAFTGTFKNPDLVSGSVDNLDVDDQHLVLGVHRVDRVVLVQKHAGDRNQLWRMTSSGQLQHEGSSPPTEPGKKTPHSDKIFVLDIEGPAPQPSQYCNLVLRRPDSRRRSTQTWRFTDEGRLTCAHNNMCVQAKDGFFGLRSGTGNTKLAIWQPWSEAVLGLPQPVSYRFTSTGVPLEQAVSRQRLRPGSGFLSVMVTTDGPTKVLQVHDIKIPIAPPLPCDWKCNTSSAITVTPNPSKKRELQLSVYLIGGLGLSLVSRTPPEELLFISLTEIVVNITSSQAAQVLDVRVEDMQIDNQLLEAACPVLLHSKMPRSDGSYYPVMPAIQITAEVSPSPNLNAVIFKHLIITLRPLSIFLEELLILRLADFCGLWSPNDQPGSLEDENDFEAQKIATQITAGHAKRYYFGVLQIVPHQIRLSMMTATKLPPHLLAIKRYLGLTLIKFEDAAVELEPFKRRHPFETSQSLLQSIIKHYKDELKWQAASILGSVDFLGNPLGFVNDVSEGVSGLLYDGNVAALVKNVTHGLSNSAAKVTESLSDGLGRVIMDEQHEETRQRIRGVPGNSGGHIIAGLKGLGFGLLGGVTSIVKQTYDGASNDGLQGFISGLGKGIVGTVTKPVVGVLDLASETASAVRDSSRSSHRTLPERRRLPRCITGGPGGLLPPYNRMNAIGQQYLFVLNNRDYSEMFIGYEAIRTGAEDLRVLISSEWVRVFTRTPEKNNVVLEVPLSDIKTCQPCMAGHSNSCYIELTVTVSSAQGSSGQIRATALKRPRVRCDNEAIAINVSRQINYAKGIYEERLQTLISDINSD